MTIHPRLRSLLPPLVLTLVALAVTAGLLWPLPLELRTRRLVGAFFDGHVWCFDHIYRMFLGRESWSLTSERLGFPGPTDINFIGWAPGLASVVLRPVLGPLGAFNAVVLASLPAAALACWALARRALGAPPWVAAGLALLYGLCPYALGSQSNRQVAKFSHWVLPLVLLAFAELVHGRRRWLGAVGLVLATVVCSFTSPSTTLFLPFATAVWGAWAVVDGRGARARTAALAAGALALTAVSLLPAWRYYAGGTGDDSFAPGAHLEEGHVPEMAPPMARPTDILLGTAPRQVAPELSSHVVYLGLPLLLVGAAVSLRRARGRSLGWALLATGVAISLGPRLAEGTAYVTLGGQQLAMPAALLDRLGYPLATGGMYYRAIVVASLGVCLVLIAGVGRLPARWAIPLAWVLAAVGMADAVRSTGELWPCRSDPYPDQQVLAELAADPTPGAVMDFPMETGTFGNELHMLAAVFHGRPTTAIPKVTSLEADPVLRSVDFRLVVAESAGSAAGARASLAASGYSHVVYRIGVRDFAGSRERLERILGTPMKRGSMLIWPLGQAGMAPGGPGGPAD